MSRKVMQRPVDGLAALRNEDLEIAAVRAEADVASGAAPAARRGARFHLVDDSSDGAGGISDVTKDGVGQVAEHLVESDALGEMQRKCEVGSRHRDKILQ
jgi:hypothetical protein